MRAAGVNPLAHFVEQGGREGRSPHPLFDATFYLKLYADVRRAGVNPLLHYLEAGVHESRDPHPLFQNGFYLGQVSTCRTSASPPSSISSSPAFARACQPNPLFDPAWYLQTYPDVVMTGQNPLVYYATQGWLEGHDPSPGFSTTFYLEANGDVDAAGVCPLIHYLRHGRQEGRLPRKGAAADDSLVPDSPPRVMLRVDGSHGAPGLRTPDRAAATTARPTAGTMIVSATSLPPRAGNEYRIDRMLVRLRKSGYRIVLVVSPLAPQTIEDARWDELAATYGNVVHCERDGHVWVRLDECPDVLATAMDGRRTRHYAALLDEVTQCRR